MIKLFAEKKNDKLFIKKFSEIKWLVYKKFFSFLQNAVKKSTTNILLKIVVR